MEAFLDPDLKRAASCVAGYLTDRAGAVFDLKGFIDEIEDEALRGKIAGMALSDDDGFIDSPESMLGDCVKGVLGRGRPKKTTMDMLKRLEEAGKSNVAEDIRKRIGT
jgi:hypothetical protein